jgi:hypothetical protein
MEPALKLLSRGSLRLDGMLAASYPLHCAPDAFKHAASSGTLKVILKN